ncbi:MAG: DegV family protein, partial [Chloroflexota bacterium]
PSPEAFREVYDGLAEEGAEHVISIHISSTLSATLDTARLGAQMVKKAAVTVFDSRQLSLGLGFVGQCAAQAAAAGRSLAGVLELVENLIQRAYVFAALDTLEFLRSSGRMNGFVARLGTLLQIKPILKMYNGSPIAEKVRTTERALRRMIAWLEELAPLEQVALVHTNAAERAEEIRLRVAHLLPQGLVPSVNVTPALGAHLGPGAVGFAVIQARR